MGSTDSTGLAWVIAEIAVRRHLRVAVAESLTGGKLAAALASAPDASSWFAGGVVAYSEDSKFAVLGATPGPVVSETCARDMATGAARLFAADLAVAVTGVGGPGRQDGKLPGTVWFAIAGAGPAAACQAHFGGGPGEVVEQSVSQALELLLARASASETAPGGPAR